MQAPEKEGRYTAYYRLTFGDNIRFGHKIWCSILVKKPHLDTKATDVAAANMIAAEKELKPLDTKVVDVAATEMIAKKAEPVLIELNDDDLYEVLEDKAVPSGFEEAKEVNKLSISSVFQSPKEIYMTTAAQEADELLRAGLITLYDFGFVEYKINKTLLQKYKNDVNMVCDILLNGALNESTFAKIFN
jgi:hypothetical protein